MTKHLKTIAVIIFIPLILPTVFVFTISQFLYCLIYDLVNDETERNR